MNKLKPRFKICFQNNKNIHSNFNINKFQKKKWILLKKFYKKQLVLKKRLLYKNKYLKQKNQINKKRLINNYKKPESKKKLFKERLFTKQQFKNFYGCISEYQLKNIFQTLKNKKNKTNIFEKFIILLESRLDLIIFRLKIAKSIFDAQQLINHKKIKINHKITSSKNYILKKGDIISFNNIRVNHKVKFNKINYVEFNYFYKICIFLKKPILKEIEYPFDMDLKLIDEYFKK